VIAESERTSVVWVGHLVGYENPIMARPRVLWRTGAALARITEAWQKLAGGSPVTGPGRSGL